ncbi:cyclopropane-fatty-acyl-phospholipid synthase family protein [Actinomadura sp. BRA 177]|uniref:SAM-dependent methyltransferase n=1 Tax=Actinomadura sp. BRA 177 TaxID=2745202 RepID=UPI0015959205|nr:methyltransferase domain-containing protein [Actinomadura sp. BRA 177]NVI91450.1 class I SAM-dependent methyltransferase [Actinomadura sp. BRA 177]
MEKESRHGAADGILTWYRPQSRIPEDPVLLRHHEIAEADHRVLNPFTEEKLLLLGEVSRIGSGTRILDLACGKGEMLCRWATAFGSTGHGVDLSEVFLAAARERATELDVAESVSFEQGDAGQYRAPGRFDVVACLGATWIGGGLTGTIELMRSAVASGGLLLIGEPYWTDEPPEAAYQAFGFAPDEFTSLAGTLDRFEAAGLELVEMVLADLDSWDRYVASQWWTIHEWLKANPDDPDAPAMREFADTSRRTYLAYNRRYLGWEVFALRDTGAAATGLA